MGFVGLSAAAHVDEILAELMTGVERILLALHYAGDAAAD